MSALKKITTPHASVASHCVYRHFLPGASSPFHVGSGALCTGAPYRYGASRGLVWHRKVIAAGFTADQVIVEIVSTHATETEARRARSKYLASDAMANMTVEDAPARAMTAEEAAQFFSATKRS